MSTQIQFRRDTAANWASVNPVLADAEPGWDDTNKELRVGDGVTPWNLLPIVASPVLTPAPTETPDLSVAVAGDTKVTIPFTIPADATGIVISRDGVVVYADSPSPFVDTGLVNGTPHSYTAHFYAGITPNAGPSSIPRTLTPSAAAERVGWIASGSYTDTFGDTWAITVGAATGRTVITRNDPVKNTSDPAVFGSELAGISSWVSPPLVAGTYTVRLLMAETFYTTAGQRVFSATVNTVPVPGCTGLDLAATAGLDAAVERHVTVTLTVAGTVTVAFTASTGEPTCCAIEVVEGTLGTSQLILSLTAPVEAPDLTKATTGDGSVTIPFVLPTDADGIIIKRGASTVYTGAVSPFVDNTGLVNGTSYAYTARFYKTTTANAGPVSATANLTPNIPPVRNAWIPSGSYTDTQTNGWAATSGVATGGTVNTRQVTVSSTTDPALFTHELAGITSWVSPSLPAGSYTVRLLIAETFFTTTGQRVFSATANGTPIFTGLDLVSAVGSNVAAERHLLVTLGAPGALTIAFSASVGQSTICGIEVVSGDVGASPLVLLSGGRFLGGLADFNNTTAYPQTFPVPAPIAIPAGTAITTHTAAAIKSAMENGAVGQTFILDAATYTGALDRIFPKQGQRLYGQGAGRTILVNMGFACLSATANNNCFFANFTVRGYDPHTGGSAYPPGNNWATLGPVADSDVAFGWEYHNIEAYGCWIGMIVNTGGKAVNCYAHDNIHNGIGGGANGGVIQYCASVNNGWGYPADGGGHKAGLVGNAEGHGFGSGEAAYGFPNWPDPRGQAKILNSYFADNGYDGIWSDVSGQGWLVQDTISVRNRQAGMHDEIALQGDHFEHNLMAGNGTGHIDWQGCGLILSSSHGATAINNYAWGNWAGDINEFDQARIANEGFHTISNNHLQTAPAHTASTTVSGNVVSDPATWAIPKILCGPQV